MGMPARPDPVTTLDEFFSLPEDNSQRHELLDGVYIVSPAPSLFHQRVVMELFSRLSPALQSRPDLVLFPVLGDIVLGSQSVVQPDLFVIPRPASSRVQWRDMPRPLLAVEVLSPTTAARDRGVKLQLYQKAGIPEYWIVDADSRLVERWRPGDTRPEVLRESISWQPSGSEPGVTIDLPQFFAEVLD
jgi:Uma2 family endonuclease